MSKPDKTDCIAFCGWGWGYGPDPEIAVINMLRHVSYSGLERFRDEKKKVKVTIFECSEDWKVFDSGSVQATYVAEHSTAKMDPRFCIKLKDAYNDLGEMFEYAEAANA